jgi:hypothetical protein
MLRNGFTRFCDDPEIACCKAEKELEQLRAELTELKALAQAKAEGRLVVLPCKVGDTVYVLTTDSLNGVEETSINRIVIKKNSIILNADCKNDDWGRAAWDFRPSDFGKTVFLTREAAEKALGGAE